jgi:hypothetical protein
MYAQQRFALMREEASDTILAHFTSVVEIKVEFAVELIKNNPT